MMVTLELLAYEGELVCTVNEYENAEAAPAEANRVARASAAKNPLFIILHRNLRYGAA